MFYTLLASLLGFTFFKKLSLIGKKIYNKPVISKILSAMIGSWLGIQGLFISIWFAFFYICWYFYKV